MAGHNEPRLLYSIPNITAYHVQNGEEGHLTPSGPQTLSLLMVPTTSPFADLSSANPQSEAPEEDFYLHLHLPPELDLAIPATTQIYHQPPSSYLIPRWDLGPESGAFTRLQFPPIGSGPGNVTQEDLDTFETILAQCTAFLERSRHQPLPAADAAAAAVAATTSQYPPEKGQAGQQQKAYNPQNFTHGQGYAYGGGGGPSGTSTNAGGQHGHIVLIDEENGSVVGELSEGFHVVEDPSVKPGSKNPVEIQLPQDSSSNRIGVTTASPEYLRDAMHPAYKNSTLVSRAATASRLIVTTSDHLSNMMQAGAETFTQRTKASPKPLTFTPTTHERVRKINAFTQGAAGLSAKTVGQVSKYAQNLGATMARRGGAGKERGGADGRPYKPGILNKSLIAFSTVADGIDQSARNLLTSSSAAATTMVGHRYGNDAREVTRQLAGGVKNVGLVYVDASGVSRKAIVKSVAKGMVLGRVKGGGTVVVGGGDEAQLLASSSSSSSAPPYAPNVGGAGSAARPTEVGFGNAAPPLYGGSGVGEQLGGTAAQGYETNVKR